MIQFKMFVPSVAVWELILRAAIIYVFVFVLLRMLGKKHVGEMAPFDLVILLILSEAVQNALVADDKSVTGGLVVAGTLFGINQLIGYATWKSKRAERFLMGCPASWSATAQSIGRRWRRSKSRMPNCSKRCDKRDAPR